MTARSIVILIATIVGVAATARLGWWQLDRAAQKTALQRAIDERGTLPALTQFELAHDARQVQPQEHRAVVLGGRWIAERTVYLENRQMRGRPGFFVITPLLLSDGTAVLVQRGWAPRDAADRGRLPALAAAGSVEVGGRIARSPVRLFEFDAAASGPIRQNLDIDAFARETQLALRPLLVLQTVGDNDGLARDWPKPAADVHKNVGYAFQWFALAALIAGLYVWFRFIRPRFRQR